MKASLTYKILKPASQALEFWVVKEYGVQKSSGRILTGRLILLHEAIMLIEEEWHEDRFKFPDIYII